ncbi:GGDEF domain-containing protein [Psychromonas aquimarina]|uniref:GGDEF domain-containing protein n=1 Tax=Psychromonas aquimarina TaxID=444919 RepID=UPI000408000A|nr:GGDEF domain-containing protein [Psychromonas aquimarina]
MKKRSLKIQFNIALFIIAGLTLVTVLIANHTARQLSGAYQRAALDFIPLMQISSNLQSSSANLKSELFALKSEVESDVILAHLGKVSGLWSRIRDVSKTLSYSPLLEEHQQQLNEKNERITLYITHTRHLARLFKLRGEIYSQQKIVSPKIIQLFRNTEAQLLPELTLLSNRLELSFDSSVTEEQSKNLLEDTRNFFRIYKRSLLLAEMLVESGSTDSTAKLNKLKRKVYLLGNEIEQLFSLSTDRASREAAIIWLQQAQDIYKGKYSVFNSQLSAIRIEVVIKTLITQQVETADQLLLNAEDIHLYLQKSLSQEATAAKSEVEIKQYLLWGIAVGGITFSLFIGWAFIHTKIIKRVLAIRTNMLMLSDGNTQMTIKQKHNDEFGDMERALQLLQGYVKQVQTMAITDSLSQLKNRRSFDTTLQQEIKRNQRSRQKLALLILDIDHFKQYNDHYGHPQGDEAIKDIAHILVKHCQRENDLVARIGGEEFAVILPNSSHQSAWEIADKIQQSLVKLNRIHLYSSVAGYLTLSIGIKIIDGNPPLSPDEAYRFADAALYQAKEKRNCIVID